MLIRAIQRLVALGISLAVVVWIVLPLLQHFMLGALQRVVTP